MCNLCEISLLQIVERRSVRGAVKSIIKIFYMFKNQESVYFTIKDALLDYFI